MKIFLHFRSRLLPVFSAAMDANPAYFLLKDLGRSGTRLLVCLLWLLSPSLASAQDILWGLTFQGGPQGGGTAFSLKNDGSGFTIRNPFFKPASNPNGSLVQGSDSYFYGMTSNGGANDAGVIFKIKADGTGYTHLKSFASASDGGNPLGSLLSNSDGYFYGLTSSGGTNGVGTIFKIKGDGTGFTLLRSLAVLDGSTPKGSLIKASDGYLYGMASAGGVNDYGSLFKIKTDGTGFKVVRNFNFSDGNYPNGSPVQGSDGYLYGMTHEGGLYNYGIIFKIKTDGTSFKILKSFSNSALDGASPNGDLVVGSDGYFYGMAQAGGSTASGTIFKVKSDGTGFTILRSFNSPDGKYPSGSLAKGPDGFLYGMASAGGANGLGTLFKINNSGSSFTRLRSLSEADGKNPNGSLVKGSDNLLYGLTFQGGSHTYGTVIKIKNDGTGFGVLSNFSTYGFDLYGDLVQGSNGFLYGMTSNGGDYNQGAIFKINYDGTGFTLLRSFNFSDGSAPQGSLVEGQDGAFYGMTFQGGDNNNGIIFKINADGSGFTSLRSLTSATDGANPHGSLLPGSDDYFYGLTSGGGDNNLGTLFKIKADGSDFLVLRNLSSPDGASPFGNLIQGTDDAFYGLTSGGGDNGFGTIFKFTGDASDFSVLKSFDSPDGTNPSGSLLQGSDDAFYGLTSAGGDNSLGTIFKFTGDASDFAVLKSFSNASTDGRNPHGSLAQGSDGTFYGMTTNGGTNDNGTIFKFTGDGSDFSLLKSLNLPTDGTNPNGSLFIQPSPLAFTQNTSTDEDTPLVLTLTGKGTAPLSYAIVTAPLHGSLSGTAPNLTYKPAANYSGSDAFSFRTYYAFNTQTSLPTTISLMVNPVNDAPVLTLADQSVRELYLLSYTIPVTDVDGAAGSFTFEILSGAQAGMNLDASTGVFTWTPTEAQGSQDYLVVIKVTDAGVPTLSDTKNFTIHVRNTGSISRELWNKVSGGTVSSIPLSKAPNSVSYPTSLEGPTNVADNYAARYRGYIYAPVSGTYTFWLASDNESDLYLSPDDMAAHKVRIAKLDGGHYTNSRQWTKYSSQKSASKTLVAGQRYYVEVLHKEAGGSDNLAVGWHTPSMAASASPVVIPGSVLAPFLLPGARIELSAEEEEEIAVKGLELTASPNPFSERVTVSFTSDRSDQAVLELYNLQGVRLREVYQGEVMAGEWVSVEVESTGLAVGMYLLHLKTSSQAAHLRIQLSR